MELSAKGKILQILATQLDKAAATIYTDSGDEILITGVIGFHDTQTIFPGVMPIGDAVGLMLTIAKGFIEQKELAEEHEIHTLNQLIEKVRKVRDDGDTTAQN